ncbi:MAG TPA: glycosyltransferase family 2 protein [Pirellulaceae bacterium]|nr:glycosyltransferase family 2 protein [Pirellulaceae bacterium]
MIGRIFQFVAAPFCRARGLHAALDQPGETTVVRDPYALRIDGWAFVPGERLSRVRVLLNGDALGYALLDAWRPDVCVLRPDMKPPEQCGFAENYRLARPIPPGVNKLRLEADLRDGSVVGTDFYFWTEVVPDYKSEYERTNGVAYRSFLASGARLAFDLPEKPEVSIVIPAYRREQLTFAALQSIRATSTVPTEIIVIDNSPDDGTARLAERVDGIRYVRNATNEGFGPAVNRAAELARGRALVIMNNDCALVNDAVGQALKRLDSDPSIGAVGGRIHLLDGTLQEAGCRILDQAGTEGVGRLLPIETSLHRHVRDIDYASAVFLAVDTDLFRKLGGFDDAYAPAYFEDTDLCTCIWKADRRVVYDPSIAVLHMENASTTHEERWKLYDRNRAFYRSKHPEMDRVEFDPARYDCRSAAVYQPDRSRPRAWIFVSKLVCPSECEAGRRVRQAASDLTKAGCRVTVVAPDGSQDGALERNEFHDTVEILTLTPPDAVRTAIRERGSREDLVHFADEAAERAYGPVLAAPSATASFVRLDLVARGDETLADVVLSLRRS